jgi:dephospho-CoA kinase
VATPRPAKRPRRVVAVTGGLAAGKSEALRAFERGGAAVCSSDEIVHRLIAEDPEVRQALEQRFGTTDRPRIAERVFADPDELAWLEGLLHPRVRDEYLAWLGRLGDDVDVAVVEIPLLYETGGETLFDAVVVVTAPEVMRRARAGERVDERSARLLPEDEKVRRADYAYVNDGSIADLRAFIARVLEELRS